MGDYVRGHPLLGDKAHPFIGRDVEGLDLSITFPKLRQVRQFLNEFLTPEQVGHIVTHINRYGAGDITERTLPFNADVYETRDGSFRACVKANTSLTLKELQRVAKAKYEIDMENPVIIPPEEIFGRVA